MTSDDSTLNYTITFADPPDSSRFVSAKVPVTSLNNEIMDVAFVKAVGEKNYHGGLPSMLQDYRFDDAAALGEHWAYKYLIDLDGQSYSGRFMGFMGSDSAVLKATVYREYFSDWIQPWYDNSRSNPHMALVQSSRRLHFIPLSSSYREVYNIHAFFSGATQSTLMAADSSLIGESPDRRRSVDGDRRLRRIARAGKQWKNTISRTVDMEGMSSAILLSHTRLISNQHQRMSIGCLWNTPDCGRMIGNLWVTSCHRLDRVG